MYLKDWILLYRAWNAIKRIDKEGFKMGWKTIVGAILLGLGYASKSLASQMPALELIGEALIAIGIILGGVGIRHAVKKSHDETMREIFTVSRRIN